MNKILKQAKARPHTFNECHAC